MFALVTSLSPGPVNIVATVAGTNHGYIKTIPHILGATVGFVSMLGLLGLGIVEVFYDSQTMSKALGYAGGLFFLYMAYKVATSGNFRRNHSKRKKAPSFVHGLLCQWSNPKAWVVSLSGIAMFSVHGAISLEKLGIFCLVFFVVCYGCISTWAVFGSAIGRLLEHPVHYKVFNGLMGALLALTVVYLFFSSN